MKLQSFLIIIFVTMNICIYGMEIVQQPTVEEIIEQLMEHEWAILLRNQAEEKQPPHELYVYLWNSNFIISKPKLHKSLSISVFNLGNNVATALYVQYSNKHQYAGIAHYSPSTFAKHAQAVKALCTEAIKAQHKKKWITTINFFIIQSVQHDEHGKTVLDNNNAYYPHQSLQHPLEHFVHDAFQKIEKKVKTTSIYYDISKDIVDHPRIFKIQLCPKKASLMTHNEKNKPVLNLLC